MQALIPACMRAKGEHESSITYGLLRPDHSIPAKHLSLHSVINVGRSNTFMTSS